MIDLVPKIQFLYGNIITHMNKLIFIIIILISVSCSNSKPTRTEIFSHFLSETCNQEIPRQLTYFIIIPSIVCKGCEQKAFIQLNTFINADNQHQFQLIRRKSKSVVGNIESKIETCIDETGLIDRIKLPFANLTIVASQNKQVKWIKSVGLDEVDYFLEWLE